MALAGVGQHFSRNFDQYTIMCVFGSVVGCVVLPLMAQSLESLIITAILFGVTVKTLNKNGGGGGGGGAREAPAEERKKEKKPKKPASKRHVQLQQGVMDGEAMRHQRELDLIRKEELRAIEKEQRSEEKRKKKAKKREERLQRKEEERMEKEKQEAAQQQLRKEREARKKNKHSSSTSDLDMVYPDPKPLRRERQHSTSSSASSVSTYSTPTPPAPPHKCRLPPRQPKRASSAPLMTATPTKLSPFGQDSSSSSQYVSQQLLVSRHDSGSPSPSPPSSYQTPGAVQMYRVLPLLPFLSPQMPHPHFLHRQAEGGATGAPGVMQQPLPPPPPPPPTSSFSRQWPSQVTDSRKPNQPAWADTASGHHTNAKSAPLESGSSNYHRSPPLLPLSLSDPLSGGGCGQRVSPSDPPSLVGGGCGPAQGFYSFLSDQASSSTPSISNIWTPPSTSQPLGEEKGEWPDWFNNSTQND